MKILVVVQGLGVGGTERSAQNFAMGYRELGHQVGVLYEFEGPRKEILEANGVETISWSGDKKWKQFWKPEIIHLQSTALSMDQFLELHEAYPDARFLETNVFSRKSPWHDYLEVSFQLSEWCLWRFQREFNQDENTNAFVLPNPVDASKFFPESEEVIQDHRRQMGIEEGEILLGRIGQPVNSKWSIRLVEVFERVADQHENTKLLLVDPPEPVIAVVSKSKLKNKIIILPKISDDHTLRVTYSSIDIFLHIALIGESFGYVNAESLLCGTPVITMSTPWKDNAQIEMVENGSNGFIANGITGYVKAVLKLIRNPQLRTQMGKEGRSTVLTRYDYRELAKVAIHKRETTKTQRMSKHRLIEILSRTDDKVNSISLAVIKLDLSYSWLIYSSGFMSLFERILALLPGRSMREKF